MLLGAASLTATLKIISSQGGVPLVGIAGSSTLPVKRGFAISKRFYARAQQRVRHNEYLRESSSSYRRIGSSI